MRSTPRVVVTVGTDHHRFDRLVMWAEHWATANPDVPMLVQRGESDPTSHAESVPMLAYDQLVAAMTGADAVVTQGGPAAIMDARSVGHRPVVVPRRGTLGEHVDDHQVRFTAWMAERDLVWLADDEHGLHRLLDRAMRDPQALRIPPDSGEVAESVERFAALVDPLLTSRRRW
ncbi:MAG: glycosyltransferase [Aquihabitans sp.]